MRKKDHVKELEALKHKAAMARVAVENKESVMKAEVAKPELEKLVGKCFKYSNSYGGSYERWPLYVKVIAIDKKGFTYTTVQFQRTSMKIVEIKYDTVFNWDYRTRFGGEDYRPIPNAEYNRAKRSLLKFVQKTLAE